MTNLRYVCLSDLHLGAAYSVLTDDNPLDRSPTLQALASALRGVIASVMASLGAAGPPQLLLLGDVLDLGLSPIHDAAMGFQRLVEAFFLPAADPPPFGPEVLFVPGNHDHFVWRWAQDDRYVQQIGDASGCLPPLPPVTPMFATSTRPDPARVPSALLTALIRNATKLANASVQLAYPNAGDWLPNGRCLVFHHGHFVESTYRAMSELRRFLLGGGPVVTVEELERENADWISFVWSTLGGAGRVGAAVESVYTRLQDPAATERLLADLSRRFVASLRPRLPTGGESEVQAWARRAARALLDVVVQRYADLERNGYLTLLGADSLAGLRWYLETPVANQILAEGGDRLPDDVVFVFGHTHKPFQDALALGTYTLPVRVFNTGGWVVDEPIATSLEGAAVLFVDDELNVVSVRLYNQHPNDASVLAHVPLSGAYPQSSNPLVDAVRQALAGTNAEWKNFADEVSAAIAKRQQWLLDHFDLQSRGQSRAVPARSLP